jgi:hypothetical protein
MAVSSLVVLGIFAIRTLSTAVLAGRAVPIPTGKSVGGVSSMSIGKSVGGVLSMSIGVSG